MNETDDMYTEALLVILWRPAGRFYDAGLEVAWAGGDANSAILDPLKPKASSSTNASAMRPLACAANSRAATTTLTTT